MLLLEKTFYRTYHGCRHTFTWKNLLPIEGVKVWPFTDMRFSRKTFATKTFATKTFTIKSSPIEAVKGWTFADMLSPTCFHRQNLLPIEKVKVWTLLPTALFPLKTFTNSTASCCFEKRLVGTILCSASTVRTMSASCNRDHFDLPAVFVIFRLVLATKARWTPCFHWQKLLPIEKNFQMISCRRSSWCRSSWQNKWFLVADPLSRQMRLHPEIHVTPTSTNHSFQNGPVMLPATFLFSRPCVTKEFNMATFLFHLSHQSAHG